MCNVKQEIMGNLFRQLLEYLDDEDSVGDFMGLIEMPLIEAVMNHCNGDVKKASKVLGVTERALGQRLNRDFGTKDVGEFQVLLRAMRARNVNKLRGGL